jgi:hypothetical protein
MKPKNEKKENHHKSSHHAKTELNTDKNRFFHQVTTDQPYATQTTTVTVNVEQAKDDCLTGCFDFLKSLKK